MKAIIAIILVVFLFNACGKEFLEKKQNKSQVIPSSINDLQALLDDAARTINSRSCNELGIIGSDEYYLSDASWNGLPASASAYQRLGYYWSKDNLYEGNQVTDWDYAYRRILYANTAYAGIEKLKPSTTELNSWNNVKGTALFVRSYAFYQLAQEFCIPYNEYTADKDLGIPLRLKPDITAKVTRSTIKETYAQIISDLQIASQLLPAVAITNYRPSQAAVYALLAKVFLTMRNYDEAGKYASLSLTLRNQLIDFNLLNLEAAYCQF